MRTTRLLATVALVVLGGPLAVAAGPGPAAAREDPPTLPPMQVVVLVDESGSLSDDDVKREREAARTIAFSVLAPRSEVSVVGFGSSNGPGQSAVNVVCKPTVLDGEQARNLLAGCVSKLHRRTSDEGDDTDHAAALQQALSVVEAGDAGHKKIVFLLTDGRLDVSNSSSYGDTAERRNDAARADATRTLDELAQKKAQVWPLGFGSVDVAALQGFARGRSCTPAAGDPRERVVSDSSKLTAAVAEAFSSAACVKYEPIPPVKLPRNGSAELRGTIPAIASEASILVYKRDERVQVEYWAPGATKPAPEAGGTNFEFAGQSTDLETVKISDPVPGEWTIRLSSADVPADEVMATVVYQAAVRTYLTVNPPQPEPGQQVDVEMQVWARKRAITDRAALSGLNFSASMAGAGFEPGRIALADGDGDGTFTGKVTVPAAATGDLAFTGQVTGIGIGGDTRVLNTTVQAGGNAVQGSIRFDVNRAAGHPGSEITGQVAVSNDSGAPVRLRLIVADPSPGTVLTVDPPLLEAAAGDSQMPFTLRVGADTAEDTISATLRLVRDDDPSVVIAERLFAAEITPVPSWPYRNRWWLLGAAVLLVIGLAVLAVRWRARNEALKVQGLTVRLFAAGTLRDELPAPDGNRRALRFTVHEDFSGPSLQPAEARDAEAYEVRRAGSGIVFAAPGKPRGPLGLGVSKPVRDQLSVVVTDGGDTDESVPQAFDSPFVGSPASVPIPGPRSESEPESYPPPQDPYASDPFGAPTTPFGNGSAPADASPAGGSGFEDLNNPFR